MAGRYKAYPEYQDSGVEWLGHVPGHWAIRRLKLLIREVDERAKNQDLELLGLSKTRGVVKRSELEQGAQEANDYSKYRTTRPGELVMNRMQAWNGVFALSPHLGMVSPDYAVFRFHNSDSASFLASLFRTPLMAGEFFRESRGMGTAFLRLNTADFLSIYVPQPPLPEQKQIAKFLDHETAKIDLLIAKQQALIALLKEKRQAVISHAVTKGLNPNAKMKDSGVEWLGQVPEHWKVVPIKYIVATPITDGPHETPIFLDEGIPFVSAEAVSSGTINFDKIRGYISRIAHEVYSRKYLPKRGDIYMVKSGATTGVTAIVETDMEFNIWSPLAVIRCKKTSAPYYVLNYLRSSNYLEAVELNWSFGTQQNIGMGVIGNISIPQPPKDEAEEIAATLTSQNSRYEVLVDRALDQINLLQERRTALISAAVTGKIDVRDWEPAESLKDEV